MRGGRGAGGATGPSVGRRGEQARGGRVVTAWTSAAEQALTTISCCFSLMSSLAENFAEREFLLKASTTGSTLDGVEPASSD